MTPDPIGLATCPSCDDLRRKEVSTRFYEARFASGYVDEWPLEKKQRVEEVIRSLGLPASGTALDYGCGNGVLTEVLQYALPNWTIEGGDLSETAVANSSARYPRLHFYLLTEGRIGLHTYDFVFTHHAVYPEPEFSAVVGERWMAICRSMEPKLGRRFWNSPLSGTLELGWAENLRGRAWRGLAMLGL